MSKYLDALLADRDAGEPAIGPCAAMPLISDAQCDAMDEQGAHLDIGSRQGRLYDVPMPDGPMWPTFLVGALVAASMGVAWLCWLS